MARKKPLPIESVSEVEAFGAVSTSRVEVWTDRHRIVGDLHVPTFGEGAKWRVSDVLNQRDKSFLSLSNVSVYASNTKKVWQGAFLAVNKNSIILLKALKE
jgi:hypothetical protein